MRPPAAARMRRMIRNVHDAALAALMIDDPVAKCAAAAALRHDWIARTLDVLEGGDDARAIAEPGRPSRPQLVAPQALSSRHIGSREGHAALLHAIAHIEFNAINLALDCVHRFRSMPAAFHRDWIHVAAEEASHFELVQARLHALGHGYGDFSAHNGLWDMACRTADDVLSRMALVPRVLEARGLDATPMIVAKLRRIGDDESVAVLDVILRDEVGHVAIGDYWFRDCCARRGLDAEAVYLELMERFNAPWPQAPLHREARLAAGFSAAELDRLARGRR
ncbi:ferritin-like domain-containing protein [Azoarcus sp. L1K30]|uniref:ferritin-like domain-containing protein n=1 Tax=Azoarcus sp. L1K30 TaxID=2820277 RepID=UPI0032C249B3